MTAAWCLGWLRPPHVHEQVETTADGHDLCPTCWTKRETEGPFDAGGTANVRPEKGADRVA